MDEEYDAIILGTGMIECVISGLLSVSGKKVLHIDRNNYYGGELASLSLEELFSRFDKPFDPQNSTFGASRDWSVDLCLKLIMAESDLVAMLLFTGVTRYLDFKQIEGSFIVRNNKIYKVPVTEGEVFKSGLLGLMEKKRMISLVMDLNKCDIDKEQVPKNLTPQSTMRDVYNKYSITVDTQELVGHVISLHQTDEYLDRSCVETFKRMSIYNMSLQKYGKSPYIYPLYGLGEIPQAFARLSAIYGGTYMLNTPVDGIVTDESGRAVAVKSGEHQIKTKMVISDPSYFADRVKKSGGIVRCICLLNHPIKAIGNVSSCQIIIPTNQTKRKSDIYVGLVSKVNEVCPQNFTVAIITARAESSDPFKDIEPGFKLLEPVAEHFLMTNDLLEPTDDGKASNVFISKSYDATTHFDTATHDIHRLWELISGEKLDISKLKDKIKTQDT